MLGEPATSILLFIPKIGFANQYSVVYSHHGDISELYIYIYIKRQSIVSKIEEMEEVGAELDLASVAGSEVLQDRQVDALLKWSAINVAQAWAAEPGGGRNRAGQRRG